MATNPYKVTVPEDVSYRSLSDFGIDSTPIASIDTKSGSFGDFNLDQAFDKFAELSLSVASDYAQGKIPDDVAQAVEIASNEKGLMRGIGTGSGARNLVARDLGLLSTQLQQTGIQLGQQTQSLIEGKRQFNINMQKSIDEANKNIQLNNANFLNNVRQLDLSESELKLRAESTNAANALQISQLIANMVQFGQDLQCRYTASGYGNVNTKGLFKDVKNYVGDLKEYL